jgi:hypothetical protein
VRGDVLEKREVNEFGMEMDQVERVFPFSQFAHHRQVRGEVGFKARRVEADCLVANGDNFGAALRIRAGEESDFVPELDQRLGQEGNDPLGAAVKFGRNRLIERRDLRDLHLFPWPEQPGRIAKPAYNDEEACWFAFDNRLLRRSISAGADGLSGTAELWPWAHVESLKGGVYAF